MRILYANCEAFKKDPKEPLKIPRLQDQVDEKVLRPILEQKPELSHRSDALEYNTNKKCF